jgi:hypothetical protein
MVNIIVLLCDGDSVDRIMLEFKPWVHQLSLLLIPSLHYYRRFYFFCRLKMTRNCFLRYICLRGGFQFTDLCQVGYTDQRSLC